MSADWTAAPSSVPYATLTNPQSLNLYAYVGNDPIDGQDADGHARYIPSTTTDAWTSGANADSACLFEIHNCVTPGAPNDEPPPAPAPESITPASQPAAQQNTNGAASPSGGDGNAFNIATLFPAADKLAASCSSTFAGVFNSYGDAFSLSGFEGQMHQATYSKFPEPGSAAAHGAKSSSTEADTGNTGPMSGRKTRLFSDFFRDTRPRQAAILVHENIHRHTGWSDGMVFGAFQSHGMTKEEVGAFRLIGNTDGITTWIMRGCQ